MTAGKNLIQAAAGVGGDFYPYTVDNSARFEDGDLPYLYRATSTPDDATRGAISFWVKRGNLSTAVNPISCAGTSITACYFQADNTLNIYDYMNGGGLMQYVTTRVFRDTSAWYHILLIINTNEATALDRVKLYVNGVRETSFSTSTTGSQSASSAWLIAQNCNIGRYASGANLYYDGYMSEVARIDGTVYSPTDFGEDKNGVWVPKNLSALSFGSEGFYMTFGNSGALGTDSSGNGNNFTSSGLTSSDQMLDTPTNNFATLNPLSKGSSITLSEGNLKATCSTGVINNTLSTLATPTSGTKVYWELTINAVSSSFRMEHGGKSGYEPGTNYLSSANPGFSATFHETAPTNTFYFNVNGSNQTTLSSITPLVANDVVQYAYDPDTGKIWVGRNGTWLNSGNPSAGTGNVGTLTTGLAYNVGSMLNGNLGAQTVTYNFGQSGFAYTPPTGFSALSTANLPEPTIGPNSTTTSDENFNTLLYTGTGAAQSITGLGFQPDFLWFKSRSGAYNNIICDAIRGPTKQIIPNNTSAEQTAATGYDLVSFDSDGFSVGPVNLSSSINDSGNIVSWAWKGNGSGVSNTNGSITSTVSANTDAGISIVKYTGNNTSGATIGHGLGVAPKVIIQKGNAALNWPVWFYDISNGTNSFIQLNLTNGTVTDSTFFTSTAPTSTVFSVGNSTHTNSSSYSSIAYCFAEVEGFSKFGSWTGASGSEFIYTGFRPAFVMVKRTNTSGWYIFDNKRGYNGGINSLQPNTNGTEAGPWATQFNLYSNGFEDGNFVGDAGTTIIYMAFAENPFKYSNAR